MMRFREMSNSRLQGFAIPASSLFLVLLLAACGSKPALPPLQKQITALGEAGHKAYARGDLAGARRDFERALNVAQGGDDADGIAMNRLNLARVAQARGDSAQAHRELDYVLDPLAAPPMGNSWRADAAARKAILLLDADNVEAAGTLVTQAQSWCNKSCPAAATVGFLLIAYSPKAQSFNSELQAEPK